MAAGPINQRQGEAVPGTIDAFLRTPKWTALIVGAILVGLGLFTGVVVLLFREQLQSFLSQPFYWSLFLLFNLFGLIQVACGLCILAERKISAYIQDRHGPNRVGWLGLFQPLADGVKFILKEDITPNHVDKPLFLLAPVMAMGVAFLGFLIIPWTGPFYWPWMAEGAAPLIGQIVSIDIGFLYLLAVGSLSVYGVVLAGYASNNKYAFYGGMRATAQMLSYEIPIGLGLLVLLMMHGSLRLEDIVADQTRMGDTWTVLLQPLVFLMLLIASFAEANRLPFDLAECEQELVGGFHTEYSAMKFSMFFLGEYAHMITSSALLVALFFGGGSLFPFVAWPLGGVADDGTQIAVPWWMMLAQFGIFWAKVAAFIVLFMVVRWTIPRFRYDQLMRLAWKGLIPLGVALVVGMGILMIFGLERNLIASLVVNGVILAAMLIMMARSHMPISGRQESLPPAVTAD